MKKFLFVIAFLSTIGFNLTAQQTLEIDALSEEGGLMLVGRFSGSDDLSFHNRSIRVLYFPDAERYDLFIGYIEDTDGNINLKYLRVEGPDWSAFEELMGVVNEKFIKWTETARANGEKNFKKKIPVDFGELVGKMYLGLSDGYYLTDLFAVFEVDSYGHCTLRLDDSEEYNDGYYDSYFFRFQSPESFSAFYELIKYENAVNNYFIMKGMIDDKKRAEENRDALYD